MAEEAAKVYEEEIDNEKMMAFCKQTHSFKDGFIRVQPYKCIFPRGYINHEDKIKNTEILEDDIWITSHPKSGQHIVSGSFHLIPVMRILIIVSTPTGGHPQAAARTELK